MNERASERVCVNTSTQNEYAAIDGREFLVSNYEIELIQQRKAFTEISTTRAAHVMI